MLQRSFHVFFVSTSAFVNDKLTRFLLAHCRLRLPQYIKSSGSLSTLPFRLQTPLDRAFDPWARCEKWKLPDSMKNDWVESRSPFEEKNVLS